MEHWGWITAGAVFIWAIFGVGGLIFEGGLHANATEPYLYKQAVSTNLGFIFSGLFLLFFYPYVGSGIGSLGVLMLIIETRKYRRYCKKHLSNTENG